MINKLSLVGGLLLLLAAPSASAQENTGASSNLRYEEGDPYHAREFTLDAFGTASLGKYTIDHLSGARVRHDARLGAGLGLTYFVTRNFGFGADGYSENLSGVLVDSASASVIFRFPLGQSGFSPYVFGGGGRQFDVARVWFAQAGAGLEYRFTSRVSAFFDARLVLPEKTQYFGVARLGVRCAF
jgi:hypothetical protein